MSYQWQPDQSSGQSQPSQTSSGFSNMPPPPSPQHGPPRYNSLGWPNPQQQNWMQPPPGFPPPPSRGQITGPRLPPHPSPQGHQGHQQPPVDFSHIQRHPPPPVFPGGDPHSDAWSAAHSGGRPFGDAQGYPQTMNEISYPQSHSFPPHGSAPQSSHKMIFQNQNQDRMTAPFERQPGLSGNVNVSGVAAVHMRQIENFDENQSTDESKSKTDADNQWLRQWVSSRSAVKNDQNMEKKRTEGNISIPEYQALVKSTLLILDQLKSQQQNLREHLHDEHFDWDQNYTKTQETKSQLQKLKEVLANPLLTKIIAVKVKKAEKKKIRIQKQKRNEKLHQNEELKRQEEIHKQLDAWQNTLYQKDQDRKRAKELKAAADSTLGEVRKKNTEALKAIQLVEGLQKLRTLRKKRAHERGLHPPKECDQVFDDTTKTLLEMMKKQKEIYEAEQRTLEVMLETEQEENLEKEREQARLREEMFKQRKERKTKEWLFGKEYSSHPGDSLYPFRQYYEQAESSLESLLQIRHQWDSFLVPEGTPGGSRLPVGWVVPSEPSSEVWASALS